nr:aldo/keto reductase [Lachnospiraceae bacterium]
LKAYDRDSFYLASKFPGYDVANLKKVEEVFEEQLKKCQVDYFDFYLFHNVSETTIDGYLNPEYGLYDYLMEQKRNGRIKHLGFSSHCDIQHMERFLEAYGKDMEFAQIQLNYLDYTFQDAKEKVELLNDWNIPIWVMEPLRGGQLASLSEEDVKTLKEVRPKEDVAAWAFRFLQGIPGVTMILSGMSNMEQLKKNIATFEENLPLNEDEESVILEVADGIIKRTTVPCTGCRYCIPKCPQGLDIPRLFEIYNSAMVARSGEISVPGALKSIDETKQPQCCIACHSCESVCPQNIHIPDELKTFATKIGRV